MSVCQHISWLPLVSSKVEASARFSIWLNKNEDAISAECQGVAQHRAGRMAASEKDPKRTRIYNVAYGIDAIKAECRTAMQDTHLVLRYLGLGQCNIKKRISYVRISENTQAENKQMKYPMGDVNIQLRS